MSSMSSLQRRKRARNSMSMQSHTCPKCWHTQSFYQVRNILPPCPHCGYPEVKTREQYMKAAFGCAGCTEKCDSRTAACDSNIIGGPHGSSSVQ